jgi:hypothetical protein
MKHTLGPWKIDSRGLYANTMIRCPLGTTVAIVNGGRSPEEMLANAALISTAPRLLQHLDLIAQFLKAQHPGTSWLPLDQTIREAYGNKGLAQEAPTTCKDCGINTIPGAGSARCPACWASRNGSQ